MRYTVDITVAANTSASAPSQTTLQIAPGTLVQCSIQFPPGPAGLVGVRIHRWGRQIIPSLGSGWIVGDDVTHNIPERLDVLQSPHSVEVVCYNDDDLYDHAVTVHLDVLPADGASGQAGTGLITRLRDALGL